MERVKIGLVGAGFVANIHCNVFSKFPNVELVGISSYRKRRAASLIDRYGIKNGYFKDYNDLFKLDLDAVLLRVPNYLHREIALAAINAGHHLLIEKPLAMNSCEGEEIVEAAKKAGKEIYYGENNIYAPASRKVKEIVNQGVLGRIYMGRGKEQHSGPHSEWFYKREFSGGGVLLDLGIHDIACLMWFLEDEIEKVFCQTTLIQPDRGKFGKCEVEDNAVGVLFFKKGTMIMIEESWTAPGGYDMKYELYGTDGQLIVDPCRNNQIVAYTKKGIEYAVEKAETTAGWTYPVPGEDYLWGYFHEMEHFIDCITKGASSYTSGEFALQVIKIIETMYRSAETGNIEAIR